MKSAGKARNDGLYRHIRTSKEIIRNLLNDSCKPKGKICGIEQDENRRTQQQIIDLIQSQKLKWAFGVYPSVELSTLFLEDHEVDVLIVKSTLDVPYYLTEDYSHAPESRRPRTIKANYIYTRVCDTNTPIDKEATPYQVESLWRRRFGLDLSPLDQVKKKLMQRKDWESYEDDDTGDTVYYNKFSPEYTVRIRWQERPSFYPFYSYVQTNESTGFYMLYVMYHTTVLTNREMVSLDSGRYDTPAPDRTFVYNRDNPIEPLYKYRYFIRDSIEYCVQQFLYDSEDSEEEYAKRRFDAVVLYFNSRMEEELFRDRLENHPKAINSYLKQEEDPCIYTGNNQLNHDYAQQVKVSKALKKLQKDWEK